MNNSSDVEKSSTGDTGKASEKSDQKYTAVAGKRDLGKELNISAMTNLISADISGNVIYTAAPTSVSIWSRFFNKVPKSLQRKGDTTYLTISRYKENYTVTAIFIPSADAFRPSFPTGFMPIDEEFVKRAIINKFENSFDGSGDYKVLGSIIYNYFIPPPNTRVYSYIETAEPCDPDLY